MKHVFIINPHSGIGKYEEVITWVKNYFKNNAEDYEIRLTQTVRHATEIAREYTEGILYAVGGDGTAHEVLNGLNHGVQLAVIPVGTGNDFSRMFGFKGKLDEFLEAVVNGSVTTVDVGQVNGELFLNCANFGLDADINARANEVRNSWIPRKMIYICIAIAKLFKKRPISYTMSIDGQTDRYLSLMGAIMNGRWYGSGFLSAPLSDFDDGVFDVCVVRQTSTLRALYLLPFYFMGKHINKKEITYIKAKNIEIKSDTVINVGCDGEVFQTDQLSISILPNYLKLRVPQSQKEG